MKSAYDLIVFDLDGTLTESGPGVMASMKRALAELNLPEPTAEQLRTFIGPPMLQSLTQTCGFSMELSEQVYKLYHQYYSTEGIYENEVYPHTIELLTALKQAGFRLCVATSKPQDQAQLVLDYFKLTPFMDLIAGPGYGETTSTKAVLINRCLEHCSVPAEKALMVGDTLFDAKGAAEAGVAFAGVMHGYGTREEMLEHHPGTQFVMNFAELQELLLTN